jgi:hypothetical protein
MLKQKVGILILFLVALGTFSCKKDNNNPTNNQLSKLPQLPKPAPTHLAAL